MDRKTIPCSNADNLPPMTLPGRAINAGQECIEMLGGFEIDLARCLDQILSEAGEARSVAMRSNDGAAFNKADAVFKRVAAVLLSFDGVVKAANVLAGGAA